MLAKTTHGASFKGLLYYCLNEKKNPEILDVNGLTQSNAKGLNLQFEAIGSENQNISKKVWHTSLSFTKQDNISADQMKEIATKLAQKVGFSLDNNQFLIVQHRDKKHMHCHIIANRIGFDGKVVDDSFSKSRVVKAAKQLEKEYGLTQVQAIAKSKRLEAMNENKKNPIIKQMTSAIDAAISQTDTKSLKDLANNLKPKGIEMQVLKHAKTGKEYGVSFKTGKTTFKGSELGKKYAFKALLSQIHPLMKVAMKMAQKGLELEL